MSIDRSTYHAGNDARLTNMSSKKKARWWCEASDLIDWVID